MKNTIYFASLYMFLTSVVEGTLVEKVQNIVPAECKDKCNPWVASTIPCVENSGPLSLSYDKNLSNDFIFNGNKIGIYFCICSTDAIEKSSDCLDCLSTRYCLNPPLNVNTYKDVCNGKNTVSALMESTNSQC